VPGLIVHVVGLPRGGVGGRLRRVSDGAVKRLSRKRVKAERD